MKPLPLLSTSKMAHLIQCVTHHLCRGHGLTRFRHRPRPTCHTAAGFPAHVFHPLAGRAPSTTCFIRDGVTTEWTCGLWLWGFRRRSCRPFQALVMVKSIHRTGGDFCVCAPRQTASTFGPKSKSKSASHQKLKSSRKRMPDFLKSCVNGGRQSLNRKAGSSRKRKSVSCTRPVIATVGNIPY
jgi:hypothetical protein